MNYSVELSSGGFHPHLIINYETSLSLNNACSLYTFLQISSQFILDEFSLIQLNLRKNNSLGIPNTIYISGEKDIELPVNKVNSSKLFLQLYPSQSIITLPLHVRYQIPIIARNGNNNDLLKLNLEWPYVFYACTPSSLLERMSSFPPPSIWVELD